MRCTVTAPKHAHLNLTVTGRQILVEAGTSQDMELSGDEIGAVEHTMQHLHTELRIPSSEYGVVKCPERDTSNANPPAGSKKYLRLVEEGVIKPAKKAEKPVKADK